MYFYRSLRKFQDAWNHRSLRTEGNSTPHQLFTSGILALCNAGMIALDFLEDVNDHCVINSGISQLIVMMMDENLTVYPINMEFTQQQITPLQQNIDPLATSENYDVEIYQKALNCLTT